jgi:hypothetical protein
MAAIAATGSRIKRWAPILEGNLGPAIKSPIMSANIANLLENQCRYNKGALTEAATTADLATYQQYAMALVRRSFPDLLAMNCVAVIPTTGPSGVYFALRFIYENGATKSTAYRQGQKWEIGFDLDETYTNYYAGGSYRPFTTKEGEMLSNWAEGAVSNPWGPTDNPQSADGVAGVGFQLQTPPGAGGSIMRKASIKVVRGAILVGTSAIKSHYTLELQQDMASQQGQDVEANLLEALQFEVQMGIDREILAAMKYVANTPALGGEANLTIDLTQAGGSFNDGRWANERIAGGVVNTILAVAQKLAMANKFGSANFAIVSPDVLAAISMLNNGLYNPTNGYLGSDIEVGQQGGVSAAGTLLSGGIKLYKDLYARNSYALLGYKGSRQGESGIVFMPYIPYIFAKTAGQEDASPRLIVKSRYAIVANLLGAGLFYRQINFTNINTLIAGFAITGASATPFPWETNTFDGNTATQGATNRALNPAAINGIEDYKAGPGSYGWSGTSFVGSEGVLADPNMDPDLTV